MDQKGPPPHVAWCSHSCPCPCLWSCSCSLLWTIGMSCTWVVLSSLNIWSDGYGDGIIKVVGSGVDGSSMVDGTSKDVCACNKRYFTMHDGLLLRC